MSTDRVEKKILLPAPLKRVWRALSDSAEFGAWFGVKFEGAFTPGAHMRGTIVGTAVDLEVAKAQKQFENVPSRSRWIGSNPSGCFLSAGILMRLNPEWIIPMSRRRLSSSLWSKWPAV